MPKFSRFFGLREAKTPYHFIALFYWFLQEKDYIHHNVF
jgi:hypothetical protein